MNTFTFNSIQWYRKMDKMRAKVQAKMPILNNCSIFGIEANANSLAKIIVPIPTKAKINAKSPTNRRFPINWRPVSEPLFWAILQKMIWIFWIFEWIWGIFLGETDPIWCWNWTVVGGKRCLENGIKERRRRQFWDIRTEFEDGIIWMEEYILEEYAGI